MLTRSPVLSGRLTLRSLTLCWWRCTACLQDVLHLAVAVFLEEGEQQQEALVGWDAAVALRTVRGACLSMQQGACSREGRHRA